MSGGVIFYGDPHGEWGPLRVACRDERPDAAVILGDCDLARPLRIQLASLFGAGIPVHWIPGNHDTDKAEYYDYLWGDHPAGILHARCCRIGGMAVAGLGGVFKGRIWLPQLNNGGAAEPVHASRKACLRRLPRQERWRDGLPLGMRDAIFPEDVDALKRWHADVLVTHEAPSCHRHGSVGIDQAAMHCRARLIVHGHHHESYEGALPSGALVRGLAKAEIFRLREKDLP